MKPHTIYVIKMAISVPLVAIIGGLILTYFIKEYKINNHKEELKNKKVDTKERIKKMNNRMRRNKK